MAFLLKPLEIISQAFINPVNHKYAWVGADQAEVIVLPNLGWSSELICWKDLLLLLAGENVKLPSPKNQFAWDVCIKQKEKLNKNRYTQLFKYIYNIYTYLYTYCHKFRTCLNVRYIRCGTRRTSPRKIPPRQISPVYFLK